MKGTLWTVATLALCACDMTNSMDDAALGQDDRGSTLEASAAAAAAPVFSIPKRCKWPDDSCVPKAPPARRLEGWNGENLWPKDTVSAITIYYQSPTNRGRFLAYGFDLEKRSIVFLIDGPKDRGLTVLRRQLGGELANIVAVGSPFDVGLSDGALMPVFRVPPPPPGPGGNDWITYKAYGAALDLAQAAENAYLSQ